MCRRFAAEGCHAVVNAPHDRAAADAVAGFLQRLTVRSSAG
ncbi:hypothetical protein [uncultured Victivallis sp.]